MSRYEELSVGALSVDSINGYLANTLGLGNGIGKVFYVAPADASTARYRSLMDERNMGNNMFLTLAEAYDATTACRNDVVCMFPGAYTVTASLAVSKSQTHIVGLGGPNQRHCPTTATTGDVKLYCATSAVAEILNVTGHYVQLHGFQTQNTYNGTANYCDILINSKNVFLKRMMLRGGNGAGQLGNASAGIPLIIEGASVSGNGLTAEDSIFGSAGNGARTTGPGAVRFETSSSCFAPIFRRCTFEMRCETSGSANPQLINLQGNYSVDRYLLLEDCFFYNFWENLGGLMDYAIVDGCATTHAILFKGTTGMFGIDTLCNVATYAMTTIANAGSDGGKGVAVDTTP